MQGVIPILTNVEGIPQVTLQPILNAIPNLPKKDLDLNSRIDEKTGKRRRSIFTKKAEGNSDSMNYRSETEEFMLLNREAKCKRDDSEELYHIHKRKQEELKAKYLNDKQEVNHAFIELYKSTNTYDAVCKLRNEQIECHKIVLVARSPFFRDLINKQELKEGNRKRDIITIIMPEWYHANTFKMIIKFFYCSTVESGLSLEKYREILLMAYHLRAYYLERLIIVEYIIPNITKEIALDLLKDTYKRELNTNNRDVWIMLENICLNSVANNSYELIKNRRSSFTELDLPLIFKIIERSLFYLVEEDQLALLLNLAIDAGFATDVCDLLLKLTKNYANCVYFDLQHLQLKYLLKLMQLGKDLEVHLMTDNGKDSNTINEKENKYFGYEGKVKTDAEKGNEIAAMAKLNSNFAKTLFEKRRPHNNRVPSGINIRSGKVPTFYFSANLTEGTIADTSVFSPAFNSDSRSWHLKLDVTSKGDVSYFLVERGPPFINETNRTKFIAFKDKIPLNFTTVLFEVSIKDPGFEKNSMIFFSFSHNQHQIIGHKNFFNIKQLSKKNNIELLVWIQEFPCHSAVIQYISEKFAQLSSEEALPTTKSKKIFDIYASDLFYILASDNLHCDSELEPFKCLYKYAALKGTKCIEKIDPLVDTIRFQYLEASQLLTMARDHEVIRNCPSFRKKFAAEIKRRLIPGSPSVEEPRTFYKDEIKKSQMFTEEFLTWMLDSEHHSGYDKKIKSMKDTMEEYKKKQGERDALHTSHEKELLREINRLTAAEKNLKSNIARRKNNGTSNMTGIVDKGNQPNYCLVL